jgi:hypothetical protein
VRATELVPRCDRHRESYRGFLTGFVSTRVTDALDAGRSVREVSAETKRYLGEAEA